MPFEPRSYGIRRDEKLLRSWAFVRNLELTRGVFTYSDEEERPLSIDGQVTPRKRSSRSFVQNGVYFPQAQPCALGSRSVCFEGRQETDLLWRADGTQPHIAAA